MKFLRILVLIGLLILPVKAQEIPEDYQPPKFTTKFIDVVKTNKRFTKNLMLIIDQSGSMGQDDITQSLNAFKMISEQPIDEMELAVIAFGQNAERWAGVKEKGSKTQPGWARLPSAEATKKANEFLKKNGVYAGGTDLLLAFEFLKSEKRPEVFDVIVISDGEFTDHQPGPEIRTEPEDIAQFYIDHINQIIKIRKKAKLPEFNLHFYGIDMQEGSTDLNVVSIIAEKFGGSFVVEKRIRIR